MTTLTKARMKPAQPAVRWAMIDPNGEVFMLYTKRKTANFYRGENMRVVRGTWRPDRKGARP